MFKKQCIEHTSANKAPQNLQKDRFLFAIIVMELYMQRLSITKFMAGTPNNDFHLKDKRIRILQTIEGILDTEKILTS